jgi:hypothetical protein
MSHCCFKSKCTMLEALECDSVIRTDVCMYDVMRLRRSAFSHHLVPWVFVRKRMRLSGSQWKHVSM